MISNNPAEGEFGWVRLLTPDAVISNRFYGKIFGWEAFETEVEGNPYTIFKKGNQVIGGMMQLAPGNPNNYTPHWMVYILVHNINDTLEQVRMEGGTVSIEPINVAGLGRLSVIQDPTGVYVGLYQPEYT